MQRNHEILLYPGWSNASDFAPTGERFGVVRLHSDALGRAIRERAETVPPATIKKLTPDARFMMRAMQTELPLLPVVTKDEQNLFCRMVLECSSRLLYGERPVAYHHNTLAIPRQLGIITSQATNYLTCKLLLILK